MEHYAGIDVSLERSSVCVVDALGKIVKEAKISSEPAALVAFFEALGFAVKRIGLEAGPLSQWLHAGLKRAGFEAVLLETRHVKAALSAMTVKTDRTDARGLAQLIRMGWFRPVHAKSIRSQEVRALLIARKQLLGRLIDVELSIRGILRGFGLKVGPVTRKGFDARIRELVTGQATLECIAGAMLSARVALKAEYEKLHKTVLAIVRDDAVCRRLMTVPSVGPVVAITYKSAIDDPNRITKSKAAGALFGLTPRKYQSGEKDVTGGITRFAAADSALGQLSFTTTVANSVINGINAKPNQFTGGEGSVTGVEVQFNVTFNTPFSLGPDHVFFRPEVDLGNAGNFLWLSAPKPIVSPGTPFAADLQRAAWQAATQAPVRYYKRVKVRTPRPNKAGQ
jgi:transposase